MNSGVADILTTAVPDCEIPLDRQVIAGGTFTPGDLHTLNLNPFKFRRKIWFACGVSSLPGQLIMNGYLSLTLKGSEVLRLPFIKDFYTAATEPGNIFFGSINTFGTASAFSLFDEPMMLAFNGIFAGTTPFRSIVSADKAVMHFDRLTWNAAQTFFSCLAIQQEFPY